MKTKIAVLASLLAILLTTCFDFDGGKATLTINPGGSSRAGYTPPDEILERLYYQIDIDGPTAINFTAKGKEAIRTTVTPGKYIISITAFLDSLSGTKYAEGTTKTTIRFGSNTANVTMYRINAVATPSANPPAGEVAIGTTVELTTTTTGADIWYTTDGSTPAQSAPNSTKYTSPIPITAAMTIKAIAVKAGMNNSEILTAVYTVPAPGTVAKPMANPSGGSVVFGTVVSLSTTTSGAEIYYTLDGSAPSSSSLLYSGSITLDTPGAVTLKAIAIKAGMSNSGILVAVYTVASLDQVAKPIANPSGGMVISGTTVTLTLNSTTSDAEIWYTTNGTTPAKDGAASTLYTSAISITITAATSIKAIAVKAGLTDSAMLEVEYTLTIIDMVLIPAGTFIMGSPASEPNRNSDETQHSVTVSSFYMGKYEVIQAQYEAVMGNNPSNITGTNLPVEMVTWYDAVEFCNKLSEIEGLQPVYTIAGRNPVSGYPITSATVTVDWSKNGYRLPTEAEWEYACRAGTETAFNWGTNQITSTQANFIASFNLYNGSPLGIQRSTTIAVGSFAPNAWGLYDMHGNVWEWCWDWYGAYSTEAQTDPKGATTGDSRVPRGGSWGNYGKDQRSACRDDDQFEGPEYRDGYGGFRLVRRP